MSRRPSDPLGSDDYGPQDVGVVDLCGMVVSLDSGEVVPITNLLASNPVPGARPVETTDPRMAYSCVAGPRSDGKWMVFELGDDDRRRAGLM